MTQDEMKKMAAEAALEYVVPGTIIGIGTGSTANHFIDCLAGIKHKIDGTVASSRASAERLAAHGIPVMDLNAAGELSVYVDGADESNHHLQLIKGGGGALTREKIVAACADKFICIADGSKLVDILGTFPLPVEVIPMARSMVARELVKRGGQPVWREGFRYRQRQRNPGCAQSAHYGTGQAGTGAEQHSGRGHQRAVCAAPGRRAAAGYRGGREEDYLTGGADPVRVLSIKTHRA